MRRVAAVCLVLSFISSAAAAEPEAEATTKTKTIFVLRHAEADTSVPGKDPPLTELGRRRATELARLAGDTGFKDVLTTHLQRTQRTAEPLAQRVGRSITVIDDTAAIVAALRAEPWGATVAVVGHSNTVGPILAGLTGQPGPPTEAVGFDQIWIVTLTRDGGASVLRLRYGPPPGT